MPTLAAALQTASEVVQPKPRDYCYMDSLPPVGECLDSPSIDTPDAGESAMEMAGGNPPADIDICVVPDVLPTVISARTVVSDKSMEIDTPDAVVSGMEVAGGSPPAGVDISRGPDALQTAVSVTTEMDINTPDTVESGMEITGGSLPAVSDISVNTDVLQTAISAQVSEKWMMIDSPDAVDSGMEMAGGSPPAEFDISVGADVLLTAISVTTVVSEKWMERFVMDLDVLCSDVFASGDDPAKESTDVASDVCVVSDSMPTAVSVRTVVTEEWMDRFVMDLVECPSASRTSAVVRTLGPAVSEEYSPVVFAGGGGEVADVYALVVVKPDTARVSVLPVAGCKFPAVCLGKVAFDVAGLGVGLSCLRVDSEETLLTVIDERAQLARAAPGVTLVDSSEEGAPASPGTDTAFSSRKAPAEERLEYAIQATAVIWEPLEQMRYVESDEVTFDSFGMAPWDAGGMYGNDCQRRETFRTMMLQWLIRLLCRPVIRNGLVRTTRMNTEYGLDQLMMTNMDSPQVGSYPG